MGLGIPPLKIKILLESNSMKPIILVLRLAQSSRISPESHYHNFTGIHRISPEFHRSFARNSPEYRISPLRQRSQRSAARGGAMRRPRHRPPHANNNNSNGKDNNITTTNTSITNTYTNTTLNPPTNIVGFKGLDSSTILI